MLDPADSVVASSTTQISSNLGGEFVILGILDEIYYGVDGTAARVWDLLQEQRTFGFLVDAVANEFDVDRQVCAHDINAFIEDLASRSLVEITRSADS